MRKLAMCQIVLIVFLSPCIQAQEWSGVENDSLSYYFEKRDLDAYFKLVSRLSDTAIADSDFKQLISLGQFLKKDFGITTPAERKAIRRASMHLGYQIYHKTGLYDEALTIYLIAHNNVHDKTTLDAEAWYVENPISTIYTMNGDYERAEYYSNLVGHSLRYFKKFELLSRYYTNLGRTLKSEHNPLKAKEIFEIGYYLADSIGYKLGVFANAINLAELHNDDPKLGSAEPFLARAQIVLPEFVSEKWYLEKKSSFEMESARLLSHQKKYLESIPLYKKAIETILQFYDNSNKDRREIAKYYGFLAEAYINTDSLVQADAAIHNGLLRLIKDSTLTNDIPSIEQLTPENSFIDLLDLRLQVLEKYFLESGDTAYIHKAIDAVDLALHVNELIRESLVADPSKLVTINENKSLISKGIKYTYILYSATNHLDYFEKARNYFTQSKSLLFNEKSRRHSLVKFFTPEDKELWDQLHKKIFKLYKSLLSTDGDVNATNGQILSCQEQLDMLYAKYEHLLLPTISPENYLEYFMEGKVIYAIADVNGHKKFLKIGESGQFLLLLERLKNFILLKENSMDEDILNDMFHFLVKPLVRDLPSRLVIIPDETIGYVPFDMLKDDSGQYLLVKSSISYSFEYLTQEHLTTPHNNWDVYCLAPKYKLRESQKEQVTRGSVYHLPFAQMEVESIKTLYGDSAVVSNSGEKDSCIQDISEASIFHYAGHAIIEDESAYLALNDSEIYEQQLLNTEIQLMYCPLELVVLSACETGLGKVLSGEGIRSLGRSFMEAGARATVISLWNVNDKSTATIMLGFHKYLKEGLTKDESLRLAKLDYIQNASVRNLHPYYWAPFIPAGNMKSLK